MRARVQVWSTTATHRPLFSIAHYKKIISYLAALDSWFSHDLCEHLRALALQHADAKTIASIVPVNMLIIIQTC